MFVSPTKKSFAGPEWVFNTVEIGDVRLEVMDLVTIAVTAIVLALTAFVFRRTLFGLSVRGASEDFDAARLMGVRANRVIVSAFAYAGLLAGVAAVLILMRSPSAEPALGSDWLIKAVVAAIIGGLGSFTGAVVGGLGLGLAEVMFRGYLPEGVWERLTDAFVFVLIAGLFIIRPQGLFTVRTRGAGVVDPLADPARPQRRRQRAPLRRARRRRVRLHVDAAARHATCSSRNCSSTSSSSSACRSSSARRGSCPSATWPSPSSPRTAPH